MFDRHCGFYKVKACGCGASSKSVEAIFPTPFAHLVFLCHILVILTIFQTPGSGISPGEGKDYALQYSGQENSIDRVWQAIVHGVTKNHSQLSDFHFHQQKEYNLLKAQMMVSIF